MRSIIFRFTVLLLLATTLSPGPALPQEALERTGYLPQFESSKENLAALETNLAKTGELADVLKKGNDELSEAIRQYRQDHKPEAKDRVYGLLGDLAGATVRQIDDIVANKDKMRDGISQVLYKMQNIERTLTDRHKGFAESVGRVRVDAEEVKKRLRELARKVKSDPQNLGLRKEFRNELFRLRSLDQRFRIQQGHQRLTEKFAKQVAAAHQFFEQLHNGTDLLVSNLEQQKEFLVMKVSLLKDAAQMEAWLRGEGENSVSGVALMTKIGELSHALEKFNAATDVLVEFNDIDTLIQSLPDAGAIFGMDNSADAKGTSFEDKYVEYFLKN
ncbi:MAG: hypothetical protein MUC88_18720 [Planctomycetes bacterium]|jgi:hypothetical protein|nr:hypothetical protein [Planctomycetota bacterium]